MNKRILLTGGAGFLGHHFCEHVMKNTDWEIIILDKLSYAGNLNRLTDIEVFNQNKDRIKFVWHDLKAPISETTHELIGDIDYVTHLASETHVDRSLKDAVPFVMSNVLGTVNLLQYLREKQDPKFVNIVSTDEVYGSAPDGVYYKEEDKFKPSNPYSASKASTEHFSYSFYNSFDMPIIIIHSMNIIGERQHPEKLLPVAMKKIINNEPVPIFSDGPDNPPTRHWIHARNVSDAILFLLDKGKSGESYNIVGEEKSVIEIVNWVAEIIKGRKLNEEEMDFVGFATIRPGHDRRYALDGSKMAEMGWKPPMDLKSTIESTVKWTLDNKQWLNL